MRTMYDAKAMAKTLREQMATRNVALSHSECLELVARQFGYNNWNILAAKIGDCDTRAGGAIRFQRCTPIIRIFDTAKAEEFYLEFLGFARDWNDAEEWEKREGPLYSAVSRDGLTLHLTEHHGDASPGLNAFVAMHGIEAFHRELLEKNYRYNRPGIEDVPWGRMMTVQDPFGNRLRFCQYNEEVAERTDP